MALVSPFGNLHNSLIERLKLATSIRYTNQDYGQLENYDIRPAVSWPCCLFDISDFDFSDMGNDATQMGEGMVIFRLGLVQYTDISNITPLQLRELGLKHYEIEQEIHKVLHGWAPDGFGRMLRRKAVTEKRDDDIRVRVLAYATNFRDDSTKKKRTSIPRPDPDIRNDDPELSLEGIGYWYIGGDYKPTVVH